MKKEELVRLHMLLAQVKRFCEEEDLECNFSKYDELCISPLQVHRSKKEHKQAVFLLATELASMLRRDFHVEENVKLVIH